MWAFFPFIKVVVRVRILTLKLLSVSNRLGWLAMMTLLLNAARIHSKVLVQVLPPTGGKLTVSKRRDIALPTKVWVVKAMVFPVFMYGCESWTIKKVNCWRTDAFELWCWKRLLRVSWAARRSNQSVLKEINPEYSLEGMMLKLKLQYFGHLMRRASLEKTLILGKTEGRRRRGWWRMRWLNSSTNSIDMSLSKPQEMVEDIGACHVAVHGVANSQTRLSDWTTTLLYIHGWLDIEIKVDIGVYVCMYVCIQMYIP